MLRCDFRSKSAIYAFCRLGNHSPVLDEYVKIRLRQRIEELVRYFIGAGSDEVSIREMKKGYLRGSFGSLVQCGS